MHLTLPATPTDRSVPGDGVTLHARDWGGGSDARPVVLLHGLSSNARIWDGVAPRLAAAGLRPVAIDQRGHGESEQPDGGYDFATVTSDLAQALRALGIRAPLLVGHSWGANVALQYAAERPPEGSGEPQGGAPVDREGSGEPQRDAVAGLVLVDGGFGDLADSAGGDLEEVRRRLRPPRFAVPLATWLGEAGRWLPPGVDPLQPWVADFLRAGVEVDAAGVARARFHFDNHMQVIDALYEQRPSRLLGRLRCPVLLCPAGDRRAPAKRPAVQRALELAPDARVTWFEDAMHDIPLQHPVELAAELAAFAAEVGSRG